MRGMAVEVAIKWRPRSRGTRRGETQLPSRGIMSQNTAAAMAADAPQAQTATKTVLIVEDNELNMKLFHDLLEAHGYRILQTRDGMEALKIARRHKPDLILMDIQLPEVSGLQVTRWIKEDADLKNIPIIAVTAFAMKGDEEKIRDGGCEAYIAKPISVLSFLQTVERFLT
jgi:two-component system, cell cycle response regulator DivK